LSASVMISSTRWNAIGGMPGRWLLSYNNPSTFVHKSLLPPPDANLRLVRHGHGIKGIQIVENYSFGGFKPDGYGRPETGDLGMTFRIATNAPDATQISRWNFVWGSLLTYFDALQHLTKALAWAPVNDPLVRNYEPANNNRHSMRMAA
jgi:hypothetical protein